MTFTSENYWGVNLLTYLLTYLLCRPPYSRRQEQDKCHITKGPSPRCHPHCVRHCRNHFNKFDRKLFSRIIHPGHCLYHLLPRKTSAHCRYRLRERQHSFQLSNIEYSRFFKNSFINRCLFKFRWLHSALQYDVFFWILCTLFVNSTFYFV